MNSVHIPCEVVSMAGGAKYTSSCRCGDVVLELEGPPIASLQCHCTMCQQWSGTPYAWNVLFKGVNVKFATGSEDNLAAYALSDASDRMRCKQCTSHVYNRKGGGTIFAVPGVIIKSIRNEDGSFIDGFAPGAEIFYGTRVKDTNSGLPTFDGFPPM